MRKIFIFIGFFNILLYISILSYSQNQLSNNFLTPVYVPNDGQSMIMAYDFSDLSNSNDIPELDCNRDYQDVSAYFVFNVGNNQNLSIEISFAESKMFGIAAYYENEDHEFVLLNCEVYNGTEGKLLLVSDNSINLSQKTIIGRFWFPEPSDAGYFNLNISNNQPENLQNKNNLNVSTSLYNPQQLVQDVLISGCLSAHNVTYTGHANARGYFSNAQNLIGLDHGVILATGKVTDAVGPNTSGSRTTNFGTPGDATLNTIIGGTRDAAVLQFNFIPASDQLAFRYVFGSEEYPEYAGSSYNDVFAFFISGGPQNYNNYNIARLPGTNIPVSINNVNHYTNSQYYVSNWSPATINIEYDGFTVPLTAVAAVTPCSTYTIKIAIADVGDNAFDSAVFLEGGSFSSGDGVDITAANNWAPGLPVMQGCNNNITFCRTDDSNINQPMTIHYTVGGTAQAGTHYSPALPTSIVIPAGQMCTTFNFDAHVTGSTNITTIILYVESGCPCDGSDEFVIQIHPPCQISTSIANSGPICQGQSANIQLNINSQYPSHTSVLWSTGSTSQTGINVSPTQTTVYTATVTYVCGQEVLSTTVVVNPNPTVNIGPNVSICSNQAHTFNAGSGFSYNWSTGASTQTITVSEPNTYSVTITNSHGCTASSSATVSVSPSPVSQASNTGPYCQGQNINLNASGGTSYQWAGPQSFSSTSQNPVINNAQPGHSGQYNVTVTNSHGCTGIASTNLIVDAQVNASINSVGSQCVSGQAINLNAAMSGGTWTGNGITSASNGTFNPAIAGVGQHSISYTIVNGACSDTDQIIIQVDNNSNPTITPTGPYCLTQGIVNLQAASPGGVWSGNGITNTSTGTFNTTSAGVGNHNINYSITNGACHDSHQITIVVNSVVDATITPVNTLCSSSSNINLSAAMTGGTWSGSGIVNPNTGLYSPSVAGPGTHIINYSIVNGACSDSDQIQINIDAAVDATITPVGPFCITDSPIQIQAAMTGGTWSGQGITNSSNGSFNPSIAGAGNHIITYAITNGVCFDSDQITIVVYADVDATITPVGPLCINNAPVVMTAGSIGGMWSGQGMSNNVFSPQAAGEGTHTISYSVQNGTCSDAAQTTVTVYEIINIYNFSDNECNDIYTEYLVEFDVLNSIGESVTFLVNSQEYNGQYSESFPSPSGYSLTITDIHSACSEYVFNGFTDCGCASFSGTMASLQIINLCDGACTDMVAHNDNQILDANDTYEFVLHSGSYPAVPFAINSVPTFCFYDIPGLELGQIYYISAIAGDEMLNFHVDVFDPCYSQSQGTPVVWYVSPPAIINHGNLETCGLEIDLSAEAAPVGMYGSWVADAPFFPINGNSIFDNDISIVVQNPGTVNFSWNVYDGPCYGTATVAVDFNPTPSAFAGENFAVCGNSTNLNAIFSLPGQSVGQWSGPYSFLPNTSPNAEVNVSSYGQHIFTWQESVGSCSTTDQVTVTFIQTPAPTITNPFDTVCGVTYSLLVHNVNGPGSWSAFINGELMNPAPYYHQGINSPFTLVSIPNYSGLYSEVQFVWTEVFQSQGVQCFTSATQNVVFSRKPIASVGAIDENEVCGNCITFAADTTGSGWAIGRWVNTNLIYNIDDVNLPNATLCINPTGSYGDSAHVRAPFLWIMTNYGCSSVDTMWITFYKQPVANAGLDNAVCGNDYNLGAVFSFPYTQSYTPTGLWSVYTRPDPAASADISPQYGDSVAVTVSHYGQWVFRFRENNAYLTSCYSTDTVRIEFVEIPVVFAGEDKNVCGPCTELEAESPGFIGSWLDNGAQFMNSDFDNPTASVCVANYGPRNFVWMESNAAQTHLLSCTSMDTVKITFWRIPQAIILTDEADSTACGLRFNNLRAQNPGTGITGYWWNMTDADPVYGNPNSHNTWVQVATFGYHDFYWIAANGPTFQPDFCTDTAGPLRIHFIEIPNANAGMDTLFCGYQGQLNAVTSFGTGVWSTPSSNLVTFSDINSPNAQINSQILNTGNASYPYFNLIWTEDNSNGCTDHDTIKVVFARVPNSQINIVPPKCFGEVATLSAAEDSLQQYSWNFYSGIVDSVLPPNDMGGNYRYFVYWDNSDDSHRVSLMTTNFWGCNSLISIDTVYEPQIPDFFVQIASDTCALERGAIIFVDTLSTTAFQWQHLTIGPRAGSSITSVYNLPAGVYEVIASYRTLNQTWYNYYLNTFGSANCTDLLQIEIETAGILEAEFDIDASVKLEDLVVPEAQVLFNNNSFYDGVRRRCVWHFGDGKTLTSCDAQIQHIYTEPGCYQPFLIIMNRDLQQCRDTAYLDFCIFVDNESKIEMPNVFTPNGDGINDFLQVKAQTLKSFNGTIINRWGNVIFEWTNWQDEEAGWNGKMKGGTNASTGVYYYIINAVGLDDVEYEIKGAVHLMRD